MVKEDFLGGRDRQGNHEDSEKLDDSITETLIRKTTLISKKQL